MRPIAVISIFNLRVALTKERWHFVILRLDLTLTLLSLNCNALAIAGMASEPQKRNKFCFSRIRMKQLPCTGLVWYIALPLAPSHTNRALASFPNAKQSLFCHIPSTWSDAPSPSIAVLSALLATPHMGAFCTHSSGQCKPLLTQILYYSPLSCKLYD